MSWHVFPKGAPSRGVVNPSNTWFLRSMPPKRHIDRLMYFCLLSWRLDRQTDGSHLQQQRASVHCAQAMRAKTTIDWSCVQVSVRAVRWARWQVDARRSRCRRRRSWSGCWTTARTRWRCLGARRTIHLGYLRHTRTTASSSSSWSVYRSHQ